MRTTAFAITVIVLALAILPAQLLAQARTTPVEVKNEPTVKAPTQSNLVQLFTANQPIAAGASLTTPTINCAGYKEIRAIIPADLASSTVKIHMVFQSPVMGIAISAGYFMFSGSSAPVIASNFKPEPTCCSFTVPVMSGSFFIMIENGSASTCTIDKASWVYLVN